MDACVVVFVFVFVCESVKLRFECVLVCVRVCVRVCA